MKKNLPSALSVLIFVFLALVAVSTGVALARGSLPPEQNNSPVLAASLNSASGKMLAAQSTPEPTLEATQEPTQESALEATETPAAGNADDANEAGDIENPQATPDSGSGNSFSEDSPAERLSKSNSASPATSIANPFSSESSGAGGHR